MLELIKEYEQAAREICEMSTAIAIKYQRRVREIKEASQQAELAD